MALEGHQVVFVGGLHRSGTSPLHRVLATHPDVSTFSGTGVQEDEGQHLQDIYPPAAAHGGPGRFALDAASHLTETSALRSADAAARLAAAWSPHWDLTRLVLVEKSPPNLIRTRFLQALFPQAAFVMVVRHPVAVTLATRKWARGQAISALLAHWFAAHERLLADAPHVTRLQVISFERLTTQPQQVLSELAGFLRVEGRFDGSSLRPGANDDYAREWRELRSAPLRRRSLARSVARYAGRAAHFGYDLDDLSTPGEWVVGHAT